MKKVLSTFGSCGDIQSMMTLSLAMQAAGHEVFLAGPTGKGGIG